jgi:hypothetical protein
MVTVDDAGTARALAVVFARAEHTLGLSHDGDRLRERARRIIVAAQGGRLPAQDYSVVWFVWRGVGLDG